MKGLKIIAGIVFVIVMIVTVYPYVNIEEADAREVSYFYEKENANKKDDDQSLEASFNVLLVNKDHALPEDYKPENLVVPDVKFSFYGKLEKSHMDAEAAKALEDMFNDAKEEGIILAGVSGYRSYTTQRDIYKSNLRTKGYDYTSIYSAQPGKSEHQTGLAIDISSASADYQLTSKFGESKEGKWVNEHCAEYGFIVRYAKDKTKITKYAYEPWHIRYVGVNVAEILTSKHLALEEYKGAVPYETYVEKGIDKQKAEAFKKSSAATTEEAVKNKSKATTTRFNTTTKSISTTTETSTTEKAKATTKAKKKKNSTKAKATTRKPKVTTERPKVTTKAKVTTEKPKATTKAPATTEKPVKNPEIESEGIE